MTASPTIWDRTKQYSNTAYEKALKPGFNKAYDLTNKLEPHVNRLSNKVGSESFWPSTLDRESDKAARILRSFCKDGVYDHIDVDTAARAEADRRDPTDGVPKGTQRVIKKIPAKVIQNAKGLAIFTCMRTGWVIGGSGGAGVLVGRHPETGEWSPPSGIHMQNVSFGFLIGVDLTDTVLVINTYEALSAFTKFRCTLGTEVGLAAGPLGVGGVFDTEVTKKPSPVWSYVKSRGLYGGVAVDGNVVIERVDENERFYGERVGVAKILLGEVRYPPKEKYKMLADTIRAAQGESVDEKLLPDGAAPSDMELEPEGPTFGIPSEDDPDPFGFKALEAEGLSIREAGTHRKATPETFEFRPSPSSPVYNSYRKSIDSAFKQKKEWRGSVHSINSIDRGTQTEDDEPKTPKLVESPIKEHESSPLKAVERTESLQENGQQEHNPTVVVHEAVDHAREEKREKKDDELNDHEDDDDDDDFSDLESDVEISTAVPVTARPKAGVVNVPKRIPPALPPRNPDRLSTRSPLSEEVGVNGFEQISLGDNTKTEEANIEERANGQINDPPATLTSVAHSVDDEFHSVPPSPMEERK